MSVWTRPGDHDNDDNDDDMFPMLWQARESPTAGCSGWVVTINEQVQSPSYGTSHHSLPALLSLRERAHFRSVPRGPGSSGGWSRDLDPGLWLVDDEGRWVRRYRGGDVTPHDADNVIVDIIGVTTHTLRVSFVISCCWKNTTHKSMPAFFETGLHMCFPDNVLDKQQMCRLPATPRGAQITEGRTSGENIAW